MGVLLTQGEEGEAQLGGAQAVDEAGDVVRIFTKDSLLVSYYYSDLFEHLSSSI